MNWHVYQWVWKLLSPIYIGKPPSGALNRTRLYVPARAIWGAMTAELARKEHIEFPNYGDCGNQIKEHIRCTYLFPAQKVNGSYKAWLPEYKYSIGLVWQWEDDNTSDPFNDRTFRRTLLHARPGTAIEAENDTAAEGSLRETECLQPFWKKFGQEDSKEFEPVFMLGFIFIKDSFIHRIKDLNEIFLGGDTRYGLGHVKLVKWEQVERPFGLQTELYHGNPVIKSYKVLAHAHHPHHFMQGDRELLLGWDRNETGDYLSSQGDTTFWLPGSRSIETKLEWEIEQNGLWKSKNCRIR